MAYLARPIARLIEELNRLPGVGPKTAQRLTYYLLRAPREEVDSLAQAIRELREKVVYCSTCFNMGDQDPCAICRDEGRDRSLLCVVERPLDVLALEKTGEYRGHYHVLHGAISPLEGVGPEDLKIRQLLARLSRGEVKELILATNPTLEGEATAMYILRQLGKAPALRVTRLARGLPVGGDLEYADEMTLSRALEGRQEF